MPINDLSLIFDDSYVLSWKQFINNLLTYFAETNTCKPPACITYISNYSYLLTSMI